MVTYGGWTLQKMRLIVQVCEYEMIDPEQFMETCKLGSSGISGYD